MQWVLNGRDDCLDQSDEGIGIRFFRHHRIRVLRKYSVERYYII